jgi:hypothetical protein
MDPPTSWAALETYEEVKVLKGVQSEQKITDKKHLKYGLRVDFINASADKTGIQPAVGRSAKQLYQMYYGTQETDKDETNVGGLLRYEQGFKLGLGLALALKATAMGLLVAIPSILSYNGLLRKVEVLKALWLIKHEKI